MQAASPSFAPYDADRRVNFTVRFELLDINARAAAVPSVSGQEHVTQLDQITDMADTLSGKYATLEPDLWKLDGTMDVMPDNLEGVQTGWWGDVLSSADGTFSAPPWLLVNFGDVAVSTIGFTLAFDSKTNNYASSIRATCYGADGTTVVAQGTFANTKPHAILEMPVQDYHSVKFEFLKTSLPYRRIRLAECLFGIVQKFDADSLESVTLTYGADLTSDSFPSRELIFNFDNLDKKYNLINPSGLYAYLQEGQAIYPHAVINDEEIDMGVFEFTSAQSDDGDILGQITANDAVLSALDSAVYSGGANGTDTLQNVVSAVLAGTGITASLATPSYTVSKAIPTGTTKREAIRLLAQASMCSVWVDRAGVLQIRPLVVSQTANDELTADRMESMGGISVSEPVQKVTLIVRNEFTTDINGEYKTTETQYEAGSGAKETSYDNPCVAAANGEAVAAWLLAQNQRRIQYNKPNRCNPAVEIGDTLKIYDAYGENRNAVVTEQSISFGAGLSATTKAVGE